MADSRYGAAVVVISSPPALQRDLGTDLADDPHDGRLGAEQRLLQGRVLSGNERGREDQGAERAARRNDIGEDSISEAAKHERLQGLPPGASRCYVRLEAYFSSAIAASAFALAVVHVTGLARSLSLLDQRSSLGAAGLGGTGARGDCTS